MHTQKVKSLKNKKYKIGTELYTMFAIFFFPSTSMSLHCLCDIVFSILLMLLLWFHAFISYLSHGKSLKGKWARWKKKFVYEKKKQFSFQFFLYSTYTYRKCVSEEVCLLCLISDALILFYGNQVHLVRRFLKMSFVK